MCTGNSTSYILLRTGSLNYVTAVNTPFPPGYTLLPAPGPLRAYRGLAIGVLVNLGYKVPRL